MLDVHGTSKLVGTSAKQTRWLPLEPSVMEHFVLTEKSPVISRNYCFQYLIIGLPFIKGLDELSTGETFKIYMYYI